MRNGTEAKSRSSNSTHPVVASVLLGMYQERYNIEDLAKALDAEARQELRQGEAPAVWARMLPGRYVARPKCVD